MTHPGGAECAGEGQELRSADCADSRRLFPFEFKSADSGKEEETGLTGFSRFAESEAAPFDLLIKNTRNFYPQIDSLAPTRSAVRPARLRRSLPSGSVPSSPIYTDSKQTNLRESAKSVDLS